MQQDRHLVLHARLLLPALGALQAVVPEDSPPAVPCCITGLLGMALVSTHHLTSTLPHNPIPKWGSHQQGWHWTQQHAL